MLWEKYGWIMYLVGAIIVAFVAYREFAASQEKSNQSERVKVFEQARSALQAGEYSQAEALFSEIGDSESALAPLASHYLAQTRLEGGGDKDGAARALSQNATSDDPFAKIAVLKSAYLAADTSTLEEIEAMLAPAIGEKTSDGLPKEMNPNAALALELIAAKAYESGNRKRARDLFGLLLSLETFDLQGNVVVPEGVRRRANAALEIIPAETDTPESTNSTNQPTEESGQ